MLNQLAMLFLILGICTALMIVKDIFRRPHAERVMNIVWPITGLYLPFFGWLAWWYLGRTPSYQHAHLLTASSSRTSRKSWQPVFISTSLCAAACIVGEFIAMLIVAGMNYYDHALTLPVEAIIALLLAIFIGVLFQFFVIRQRSHFTFLRTLRLAFKAQIFPLLIYQAGNFLYMALALRFVLGDQTNPMIFPFWFMLQIAMVMGFIFSWPANQFLIKRGLNSFV